MFFELQKDWNGHKPGARLALSDADAAPLVAAGVLKTVYPISWVDALWTAAP